MTDEVTEVPQPQTEMSVQAPDAVIEPTPAPIPEPAPIDQTAHIPANEPTAPPATPPTVITPVINLARDLAVKARAVIQSRKRKKLDKILEAVSKHGNITNDQVEKLLHVSDATATRYLAQLEKEGKLKQEGRTGKSVKYQKL